VVLELPVLVVIVEVSQVGLRSLPVSAVTD
jgi:hypothetical protein